MSGGGGGGGSVTRYTKTFTTICPARLLENINADSNISPTCLQIITQSTTSIFEFDAALSSAEQTTLNTKLFGTGSPAVGAWSCPSVGSGVAPDNHEIDDTVAPGALILWTSNKINADYYNKIALDGGQLDTRYYTETETDTLLASKSNVGHTHVAANVTDFNSAADARADIRIAASSIEALADVGSFTPADGQVLTFNNTSGEWEAATPSSGVTDHGLLNGLTDDDHAQYIHETGDTMLGHLSFTSQGSPIEFAQSRHNDGTYAKPSYTFTNETGTGMYREPSGDLAFANTGTCTLEIASNGRVFMSNMVPNYETLVTTNQTFTNKKYVDDQIATREPSFTKNTAFNKDFGTSLGDVAQGNHNHDSSYSALGHTHTKTNITDFTESDYVHVTGVESVAGNKTFSNDIVIQGNLTVNGTQTTVNTQDISVADNIITLNADVNTASPLQPPTQNSGIEVARGTETDASLLWNETLDKWTAGIQGSETEISLSGHTHTKSNITDFTESAYVHTTGTETVGGIKTFSDRMVIGHTFSTTYRLSLQSNTNYTYLEILNNAGTNKGAFFGIGVNDFELWNWQGGPVVFYTAPTASDGYARLTIQNNGDVKIHNLSAGVVKSAADGTLSNDATGTAFNKNFGTSAGDVAEGNHNHTHDSLQGVSSSKHIDHLGVSVLGGTGLSGGGNLTTSQTLNLDINSLTTDASPNGAADYVATYDASGATHKKVLLNNLPSNVSSSSNITDHSVVRGDGGTKGIQDSAWLIDDNGRLTVSSSVIGTGSPIPSGADHFIMHVHNTATSGGGGLFIQAGEAEGDVAFRIMDENKTFHIVDVHADDGNWVFGDSYNNTLLTNGIVYGFDNQYSSTPSSDFNTQNGVYRIGGQASMHGTYFEDAESDSESSTSSTSYVTKLTHTTPSLPNGKYRIGYSCELSQAYSGYLACVEVKINADVIANPSMEYDGDWNSIGGFAYRTLSGVQTITIKYKTNNSYKSAKIRYARLEIWRVS